jgi:hypothetical protein
MKIAARDIKFLRLDLLFCLWSAAALCAAVSHTLMPFWTAAGTTWIPSVHWQREIAYFDIFIAGVLLWAARQKEVAIKRQFALLLCVLSVVLGENHLEGWLQDAKIFHVLFTVANFCAALWAIGAYWLSRRSVQGGLPIT